MKKHGTKIEILINAYDNRIINLTKVYWKENKFLKWFNFNKIEQAKLKIHKSVYKCKRMFSVYIKKGEINGNTQKENENVENQIISEDPYLFSVLNFSKSKYPLIPNFLRTSH